jgi:hypothetical protein
MGINDLLRAALVRKYTARKRQTLLREAKIMGPTGTSRKSPAVLGIPNRLADGDTPHTADVVWMTGTD